MAYYREQDYSRLLSIVSDREKMHNSWHEWHQEFLSVKRRLSQSGLIVQEYEVDLDELIRFCFQKGLPIDGNARSQFVTRL